MKRRQITIVLLILLVITGCRKQYRATEVDLANYGWTMFEEGNYSESNRWFLESLQVDSLYKDGYNGAGWSFGKVQFLDSSIVYFSAGLDYVQDPNILANTDYELKSGLCFAFNALGDDSSSLVWGNSLLTDWATAGVQQWTFSHDTTITHLDVYVVMAVGYFRSGLFAESLSMVQSILLELDPTITFAPDINTVAGRNALADEIEFLQVLLR